MVSKPAIRSIRIDRPRLRFQKTDHTELRAPFVSSTNLAARFLERTVLLESISVSAAAGIHRTNHFVAVCIGPSNSKIRSWTHLTNQPYSSGQADFQRCYA